MRVFKYTRKKDNWTSFDNRVLLISKKELSPEAFKMYVMLTAYKANGKNMTRAYIIKVLNISENTYKKNIRQLKALDLILIEKIAVNIFECYVGNTVMGASLVKKYWNEIESEQDKVNFLTAESLQKLREEEGQ